jgi:transcriptional repressor NrdR
MYCPFCQHEDTRVIDSRLTEDGSSVRRRRECPQCGERFNTYETAELKLPAIVKSGERRETFDERKLRVSFERALQKRPVSSNDVDAAVRTIINDLRRSGEREVPSRQLGELVMFCFGLPQVRGRAGVPRRNRATGARSARAGKPAAIAARWG